MENLWFIFLILTATLVFFISKLLWSQQNPNLPPSPKPLPIIGHLHLIKKYPLPQALRHLTSNYGPVVFLRFGCRAVLSLSSPQSIEECFTNHDITLANRPRTITSDHFSYAYKNFGFAPYGDLWRTLRRLSTLEVFSSASLQKTSFIRYQEVSNLCSRLFRLSSESRRVDLKYQFNLLTANVMLRLVSGKRGVEDSDPESERRFLDDFKSRFFSTLLSMSVCDYFPVLRWFGYKGIEKRVIEMQRMRDEYLQRLVDDIRMKKFDSTGSVVEKLLKLQESEPEFYSDDVIKGIVVLMFNAGSDTSPVTMEWAMSLLLNHPYQLQKVREEIKSNVKHKGLIQDSDLSSLPYLRCVIYETLRLYPAAPLLPPHCSSKKFKLGNYEIPENTVLLVNAWAVHRDSELWEEADVFKPERFEGFVGDRDGFRFLPFGVGRRACPAAGLAMRLVSLVVGALVQCFEWKKVENEDIDMRPAFSVAMSRAEPLAALPKPWPEMVPILSQL
ncbi:PREDICTED: isoflavone 2'-hydroxylase-like [Camelina sativa]|uniref:Isoflavone 2'-hydroxylase-like n=1 Tax=Camelina sativa TaxID=90675 RepID=A0ABM0XVU6_CAMSA|nr:PREDICTED: isoflavone 2'-hydroxylase-like [Camelina sativa]